MEMKVIDQSEELADIVMRSEIGGVLKRLLSDGPIEKQSLVRLSCLRLSRKINLSK